MRQRDDLNRASEHLDRAAEHTGDAAHHTKEGMQAAASGTLERTKDVARETGRKVGDVAERAAGATRDAGHKVGHVAGKVAHAQPDVELEQRADHATENVIQKAGDAIRSAAPVIGRGAEMAVGATGAVVHAVGGPLGTVIGKIAGRVGGWWSSASEAISELPQEEEQACRVHFEAYTPRTAEMTFERALPAYSVGYVAATNPDYRGRPFTEIEPDLRHGFGNTPDEYDTVRDFTRYGYERGTSRPPVAR
jgi:hypothetical protein